MGWKYASILLHFCQKINHIGGGDQYQKMEAQTYFQYFLDADSENHSGFAQKSKNKSLQGGPGLAIILKNGPISHILHWALGGGK